MFGLNLFEIIVILIVALIVFGPEQLPVLASKLGKLIGSTRKSAEGLRREFYNSVYTPAKDLEKNLTSNLTTSIKKEIEDLNLKK